MAEEKILNLLLNNPSKNYGVRELAKLIKISPASVSNWIKSSKEIEIIKVGNQKRIQIKKNKRTDFLKRIENLKMMENSGLIEFLEEEYEEPKAIILFGSFSRGNDIEKSDIDIAVFTKMEKNIDFSKFEKKLGKKIEVFEVNENTPENLLKSIYNGIVLRGLI